MIESSSCSEWCDVGLCEELHELLGPGERERDRERAAVRSADHDQPPAAPAPARVVHRLPRLREELDEATRDEPAHRVCDEVHGVAGAERLDLRRRVARRSCRCPLASRTERPHVPARVELHEQRHVRLAVDARGADVDVRGARTRRRPSSSRSPIRPAIRRTKLIQMRSESPLRSTASSSVPMIPGRTIDLAELSAAPPARRRARGRARTPRCPISCSSRRCSSASSETRIRRAVSMSARSSAAWSSSSRGVSGRLTIRRVPRREGARGQEVAPADACDRCAAASAIGGDVRHESPFSGFYLGILPHS